MEQAFSPPSGRLPPPRSGQRDLNHRMSSGGPMLRTDAPCSGILAMLAAMRRASSSSAVARLRHAVPSAPRLLYLQRREGSYSQRDTSTCGG